MRHHPVQHTLHFSRRVFGFIRARCDWSVRRGLRARCPRLPIHMYCIYIYVFFFATAVLFLRYLWQRYLRQRMNGHTRGVDLCWGWGWPELLECFCFFFFFSLVSIALLARGKDRLDSGIQYYDSNNATYRTTVWLASATATQTSSFNNKKLIIDLSDR